MSKPKFNDAPKTHRIICPKCGKALDFNADDILKDQLIGQSPEDLERHYKLIGKKDAMESLLKYMQEL